MTKMISPMKPLYTLLAVVATAIAGVVLTSAAKAPMKPEMPDMERIAAEVSDPSSKYYYPDLMRRYEANETIMGLDEYRHLYLGYVFQEDYDPYRHSEYSKMVEDQYYKTKHTKAECDTIIKYAELSLNDNPFDLRQDQLSDLCPAREAQEQYGQHMAISPESPARGHSVDRIGCRQGQCLVRDQSAARVLHT